MRPDFGHNQNKRYAQRYDEAQAWAKKVGLPGPLLVDSDPAPFMWFGKGLIPASALPKTPHGKPKGWAFMYILNAEGLIVYQHGHCPTEFKYCQSRVILDRLLDPAFDEAYRAGFPDKSATLLPAAGRDGGQAYADDFESYKDSCELRLSPRWGFRQRNRPTDGVIQPEAGRGGSQGLAIKDGSLLRRRLHSVEHAFPRPLGNGHFRFHVRRGPSGRSKKKPQTVLRATFYGADGKGPATLSVAGDWLREAFALNGETTTQVLSEANWHEIVVTVRPEAPARVTADGKPIGELAVGPLTKVGFNCGHHSHYLDNVELFYAD